MRILFLGDIVARPGRTAIKERLQNLRAEKNVDFVVANGENASGGLGLTKNSAKILFKAGVDVLTSGNHIYKYKEIYHYLDEEPRLLRPANYPTGAPGNGLEIFDAPGATVAVLNLMGRTFMEPVDCPFQKADALLETLPEHVRVVLVDFHAETTSEKIALAYYLDGRVSAVLGTHTHVQTSDARVLPGNTAAITDAGMCGVQNSILGMEQDAIVQRFITKMPTRFTPVTHGKAELQGVLLNVDVESGKAIDIETIKLSA